MKIRFLLQIVTLITASAFYGCNSEVFIDDYAPSVQEVTLSEENPVSEICFESSNWDLQSVYHMDEDGTYHEINGDIYGYDGSLIAKNSSLCTSGSEPVKMTVSYPDIKLTIERKDATHLVLSKPENMDYETKRIYLSIGNTYNIREIAVDIESSTRYRLDSIAYTLNSWSYRDSIVCRTKTSTYANLTDDVTNFDIYPYKRFTVDYAFVNRHEWETVLTEDQLKIFGKDIPVVPVPNISRYEIPVLSGLNMPLSAVTQHLPLPDEMLELKESMPVNSLKQRACTIKCWFKYYGISFKIYASHPKTAEKRILEGLLDIYIPRSYSLEFSEEVDVNLHS